MEDKKTAVVTGGNRGIGAGITRVFAEGGYSVLVGARTQTPLTDEAGGAIRFKKTDCTVPAEVDALAEEALSWTGRLDVWVNCAGFSGWRPIEDADEAFWDTMVDTNLKGTFFGCKAAAARMGPGGSILNISSVAGRRGSANNSVYVASKFGVTGLTQSLAKELGPRGIRVNAVCPVYVRTEGLMKALEDPRSPAGGGDVEEYLARFTEQDAALRRLPSAEDVGEACLFLASDAASAITGQSLSVDCGVFPR